MWVSWRKTGLIERLHFLQSPARKWLRLIISQGARRAAAALRAGLLYSREMHSCQQHLDDGFDPLCKARHVDESWACCTEGDQQHCPHHQQLLQLQLHLQEACLVHQQRLQGGSRAGSQSAGLGRAAGSSSKGPGNSRPASGAQWEALAPLPQLSSFQHWDKSELPQSDINGLALCVLPGKPNSFCCVQGIEEWNKHRTNFSVKYLLLEKACSRDPTWEASDRPGFVQQWSTRQKLHQWHHPYSGEATFHVPALQDHLLLLATTLWQGLKNLQEQGKKHLLRKFLFTVRFFHQ